MSTGSDLVRGREVLADVPGLVADAKRRRLEAPIPDGAPQSLALMRRAQDAGVAIEDFQLRRPGLDDVLLALTGAPATTEEPAR